MRVTALWVAGYAAFVGTAALGWNIVSHFLIEGRPRVRIDAGAWNERDGFISGGRSRTGLGESWATRLAAGGGFTHAVQVTVVNRGREPFTVTEAGVRVLGGVTFVPSKPLAVPEKPWRIDGKDHLIWIFDTEQIAAMTEDVNKALAEAVGRAKGVTRLRVRYAAWRARKVVAYTKTASGRPRHSRPLP